MINYNALKDEKECVCVSHPHRARNNENEMHQGMSFSIVNDKSGNRPESKQNDR